MAESLSTETPTTLTNEIQYHAEINRVIKQIGYEAGTKVTNTLQGSVWRISRTYPLSTQTDTAILKVCNRYLHKNSYAKRNGKTYKVKENILSEKNILKHLTQQKKSPNTISKYHRFFATETDFYLLMEDGGGNLFHFIRKAHELISSGKVEADHWQKVAKIIFKQMVEAIDYIHSQNVCHFDISLENFVINDVSIIIEMYSENKVKNRFLTDSIQIKLCDFGLAKMFANCGDFSSNKWCGKSQYQSPEVVYKQRFDAKKNDIWCLGFCLFLISFGTSPWNKAETRDTTFNYVMKHSVADLLRFWHVNDLYDEDLVPLMDAMLRYENDRISLANIKKYIGDQRSHLSNK